MAEAFRLGGWGMYPILVFGVLFIGATLWYAVNPERKRLLLPGVMGLVTMTSAMLGFFTGVLKTLDGAANMPNSIQVAMIGVSESLNDLCFGFVWLVMGGLVVAAGAFRAGRQKPEPSESRAPVVAHS